MRVFLFNFILMLFCMHETSSVRHKTSSFSQTRKNLPLTAREAYTSRRHIDAQIKDPSPPPLEIPRYYIVVTWCWTGGFREGLNATPTIPRYASFLVVFLVVSGIFFSRQFMAFSGTTLYAWQNVAYLSISNNYAYFSCFICMKNEHNYV